MKIRNDFVTNSSSSSYIIAYKEGYDEIDELLNRENYCETTSADRFHNMAELDDYLNEHWSTFRDLFDGCKYSGDDISKMIQDGYSIAIKEVGYADEDIVDEMSCIEKRNNNLIILNCVN